MQVAGGLPARWVAVVACPLAWTVPNGRRFQVLASGRRKSGQAVQRGEVLGAAPRLAPRPAKIALSAVAGHPPNSCAGPVPEAVQPRNRSQVLDSVASKTQVRQPLQPREWVQLRKLLSGQRREAGRSLYGQAFRAEASPQAIFDALGIDASPEGIRKLIV